jgi:hypothetical protein
VRELLYMAAIVYDDPRRACRLLLRSMRRHGEEHTRAVLVKRPEAFGRLIHSPDYRWLKVIPVPTAAEARAELPRFRRSFDAAAAKRGKREKAGRTARALARMDAAGAALEGLRYPRHNGDSDEEGRPRARDPLPTPGRGRHHDERKEAPAQDRAPACRHASPEAAPLIREAIRESEKHSGEDPIWIHGGMDLELGGDRRKGRGGPEL